MNAIRFRAPGRVVALWLAVALALLGLSVAVPLPARADDDVEPPRIVRVSGLGGNGWIRKDLIGLDGPGGVNRFSSFPQSASLDVKVEDLGSGIDVGSSHLTFRIEYPTYGQVSEFPLVAVPVPDDPSTVHWQGSVWLYKGVADGIARVRFTGQLVDHAGNVDDELALDAISLDGPTPTDHSYLLIEGSFQVDLDAPAVEVDDVSPERVPFGSDPVDVVAQLQVVDAARPEITDVRYTIGGVTSHAAFTRVSEEFEGGVFTVRYTVTAPMASASGPEEVVFEVDSVDGFGNAGTSSAATVKVGDWDPPTLSSWEVEDSYPAGDEGTIELRLQDVSLVVPALDFEVELAGQVSGRVLDVPAVWGGSGAYIGFVTIPYFWPTEDMEIRVLNAQDWYGNTAEVIVVPKLLHVEAIRPVVSGDAVVGRTLMASPGSPEFDDDELPLEFQWFRGETPIPGATGRTYTLQAQDAGAQVSVRQSWETAAAGPASSRSVPVTVAKAPLTTTNPTISGTAQVGRPLTAAVSGWAPSGVQLSYQWLRDGRPIAGATGAQYVPAAADVGRQVSVLVRGTLPGYLQAERESDRRTVAIGQLTAPRTKVIGPETRVGDTIRADTSMWAPSGIRFSYQWYRDGRVIPGATKQAYTLQAADLGSTLTVQITGSLAGYVTKTVMSWPSKKVAGGVLVSPKPTISGSPKVGELLTAVPGSWTKGTTLNYQWLRDGKAIKAATSKTYRVQAADRGKLISVKVKGKKPGYWTSAKTSKGIRIAKR